MALKGNGHRPPHEMAALLSGGYPSFVYRAGRQWRRTEPYLPVFVFHTIDAEDFDAALRYLEENDYRTVTLDDAAAWLRGETQLPARSVVLTIDDGRLSTWSVGYALLEARGMVATAFVIPGYLEEGPVRPRISVENIDAAPPGLRPSEDVDRCTSLRWSEVEALHESGVVSIESHTMLHRRVAVSERLDGFLLPAALEAPRYLVPMPPTRRSPWGWEELEHQLGAPLFASQPLLAASEGRVVPEELHHACVVEVARAGGADFFRYTDWRRELEEVVRGWWPEGGLPRQPLDEEKRWELLSSKQTLEERLPGKHVRHLCLPEGAGSRETAELARECGYESCVGAFMSSSRTNRPGASPYRIGRLKHDYLFTLPGKGRRSLPAVLWRKSVRRAVGRTGF